MNIGPLPFSAFQLLILAVFVTAIFQPIAAAGITFSSAENVGKDQCSVIIAKVDEIKAANEDDATHLLIIEPLATIAGDFDPSIERKLRVRMWVDNATSSVRQAPRPDALVMVVIRGGMLKGEPVTYIVSDVCTFMPQRSACVTVTSLEDKVISETLARIREEREKISKGRK
jgi:hypothetical protein